MAPIPFTLADGSVITLNDHGDPLAARYLSLPKAFAAEMVSQINDRHHYDGIFTGKSGLVFLDLGANLGIVSIYASPCCRRVVAVEAEPETCGVMEHLCRPFPQIECVSAALYFTTGHAPLSVNQRNWTCHTLTNHIPGQPVKTVRTLTLGDLVIERQLQSGIDICKVDVEGAEMRALTEEAIAAAPVKRWYIEVHQTPGSSRQANTDQMKQRLEHCGFKVEVPRIYTLLTA